MVAVAAVAVTVILLSVAGIAVLLYQRGDERIGDPPPVAPRSVAPVPTVQQGGSKQDQAAALDAVLSDSVRSRQKLNSAIDRVRRCADLDRAVADMLAVGNERRSQLDALGDADVDKLPNGEKLRSTLTTALRHALDADQAYVEWARPAPAEGCGDTSARRAAYGRGEAASTKAGQAKTDFLGLWNPVAVSMGLKPRTRQDI